MAGFDAVDSFMAKGSTAAVEYFHSKRMARVEIVDVAAQIDHDLCCQYFDEASMGKCDKIEIYQGHRLSVVLTKGPVLGWVADHRGRC